MDGKEVQFFLELLESRRETAGLLVTRHGDSFTLASHDTGAVTRFAKLTRLGSQRWALCGPKDERNWHKPTFVADIEAVLDKMIQDYL